MSYSILDHLDDELRNWRDPSKGARKVLGIVVELLRDNYKENDDCQAVADAVEKAFRDWPKKL